MKKLNVLMIAAVWLGTILLYSALPAQVPMHWNIRGEVDSYWPKELGAWLMPALVSVMAVLFRIAPNFDPKKDKYRLFTKEWEIIQTGIIGFMAYMHFLVLYVTLNPEKELLPGMFIGLGALFVLLGNYLSKIRQNYFLGIRLPWTLANEDNWNKTHRYASWLFVITGLVTLIEAYVIWYAPVVIFGGIMLSVILPAIYSFLLFKKKTRYMKLVYLALGTMVALMFLARLSTPEDSWLCVNGQWIKHGQPTMAMPSPENCKK